jgi:hypothetical protein
MGGAVTLAVLAVIMMVAIAFEDRNAPFLPRDIFHNIVISNAAYDLPCTGQTDPFERIPHTEKRMYVLR